jgi:serine/threonine protein kinase
MTGAKSPLRRVLREEHFPTGRKARMAASPGIDRQTFLAYLRQSGLVGHEQLHEIAQRYADLPRGRTVARALVHESILTRFQAERLLVGRTAGFLLGQYRILEQIGRGGMGRVYKAIHTAMDRIVAVKVLAPDVLAGDRASEMFLHEVRAVAQLVHPNIVTAFDASETSGRYYLVLEYVDGPTLDQLVRKQGPLSVGLACDYIRQAASGLQCAHARGMVHRDVKPANILVQRHGLNGDDSPGLVKISDFGLARLAAPTGAPPWQRAATIMTRENTVMGTPDYLSPEQSRNLHKADIRSDLYSLGCTFYFLLTGSAPFPGGTAMEKMIRHATEKPAPISDFRDDVPGEVIDIIDKLMAKHPNDRFQTPAELANALQPYAVSGPTPWAMPRATPVELSLEALKTADDKTIDYEEEVPPESDGELITSTSLPANGPATPRPANKLPARSLQAGSAARAGRRRSSLVAALAVIVGLMATAAVLALLLK